MGYSEVLLSTISLNLDKLNPRHPDLASQHEVIAWMLNGNNRIGDKLVALAKDIVRYGLNPADKVIVTYDPDSSNEYQVLEGNRRVTAIKLLNNPELTPSEKWKQKFIELAKGDYKKITEVPCVLYDDEEEAFHFVELKHLGESEGAGTVPWDSEQKSRHELRANKRGRNKKTLDLIDFVSSSTLYDSQIKAYLKDGFPITTLDRLLTDVDFRAFLGLGIDESGNISFLVDEREAAKAIAKVIGDLGSGAKTVRDVINKKAREAYMSTFGTNERADLRQRNPNPSPVGGQPSNALSTTTASAGVSHVRYQNPAIRKHVVLVGTNMPIDPRKYNRHKKVYEELRKLPLKDAKGEAVYPNAAILLIRLFIEISVQEYLNVKQVPSPNPNGWSEVTLVEKIKRVLEDLEKNGGLDKQRITVIKKLYSDPKKLCYPGSLNDFVHNRFQVVTPTEVSDFWDSYSDLLVSVYKAI